MCKLTKKVKFDTWNCYFILFPSFSLAVLSKSDNFASLKQADYEKNNSLCCYYGNNHFGWMY